MHKTIPFSKGQSVVITEKMDGENSSLYNFGFHARSVDSRNHSSRDWLKQWHSSFAHEIPDGYRICGENVYAKHSIHYTNLKTYFYGFSLWKETLCLSWTETIEWFSLLGIEPVPVLYHGPFSQEILDSIVKSVDTYLSEGIVIRDAGSFEMVDFGSSIAKWVRKGHVQTSEHWMHSDVITNKLE